MIVAADGLLRSVLVAISLLSSVLVLGQLDKDSLKNRDFQYLKNQFNEQRKKSSDKASAYARAYVRKAKEERDTLQLVYGYYYLQQLNKWTIPFAYCDSIIELTKHQPTKSFPMLAY